ncbi:MAG TPA: hypothetical protein VLA13_08685 [Massilibacterium sp.]|nr:hypothetical protein [Massilibacterium sp.]
MNKDNIDPEILKLFQKKVKKFPPPWTAKCKITKDGVTFYSIQDAWENIVTQVWDPQDAQELLLLASNK